MWAESPTNLWANQPTAVRDSLFKEKLEWGAGAAGGGGESCYSYCPPPTMICVMHTETCKNRRGKQNRMAFWT
jgi:hypothetical protein